MFISVLALNVYLGRSHSLIMILSIHNYAIFWFPTFEFRHELAQALYFFLSYPVRIRSVERYYYPTKREFPTYSWILLLTYVIDSIIVALTAARDESLDLI